MTSECSIQHLVVGKAMCLMEIVKPPRAVRFGVVIQDSQLLMLLRDASQTSAFFPCACCTPVLLTSSEALSGVHYVLLTNVNAATRSLVVHDSKGRSSKCGKYFKAMLHRLGWTSHWNSYGTQHDQDSCGFRTVFMAMQVWSKRRVTGQLPRWFIAFCATTLQLFANNNSCVNSTIDRFDEGYFEDASSWYDQAVSDNSSSRGSLPALTPKDYAAAKQAQGGPSRPADTARGIPPKAPTKKKKPNTLPTRRVPKNKKRAMPQRTSAKDVPPTRSRAGKADPPPHKRTRTDTGPKQGNNQEDKKEEEQEEEEEEQEEDTPEEDTSRGRRHKQEKRKRQEHTTSSDGNSGPRRQTSRPLDLAAATEVDLDQWINELGRSDGVRQRRRALAIRVLGTSNPDEARRNYRMLAIQFHLDKNTQDPLAIKRFQLLKPSLEAIK